MTILIAACLLLAFCLALVLSLVSVLRDLLERNPSESPVFHDSSPTYPGPMFHGQVAAYRGTKSQFAWQSRPHSRAPD
jgi:hypothetical protein